MTTIIDAKLTHPLEESSVNLPEIRVNEPLTMVIFGATGDLTRRKLLPALYAMKLEKLLPDEFRIVAFARRDYDDTSFRTLMFDEVKSHSRLEVDDEGLKDFLDCMVYHKGDLNTEADYTALKDRFEGTDPLPPNAVYYLSTAPTYFESTIAQLKHAGLISEYRDPHWTRVVIEKPFGHDLESATELNTAVLRLLDESQVYRIDHYLGKETVQNILSFRFANAIFEPLFNNQYVDNIQVTASETVGMESGRGAYYDTAGALRDMFQNHLLQLMCLAVMEPPSGMNADAIRNEKVKALQSIVPLDPNKLSQQVVRGQYGPGLLNGEEIEAYVQEDRVPIDSKTETFLAAKFYIDNWRWAGVPIFLRTGKRLEKKMTQIAFTFKRPPLEWFKMVECEGDVCDLAAAQPNVLVFRIAPDEGISLSFLAKRPAMQVVVENATMNFMYSDQWAIDLPEAYERLLMDVMRGDSTLFTRSDEVEAAWRVVDPILRAREDTEKLPLYTYKPGAWGPLVTDKLFDHPGATMDEREDPLMAKENQQPITGCGAGEVAEYAFLCGDPERIPKVSEHWDEVEEVARIREYVIHTGLKDGVRLTAASTGIGGPSTAVVLEELAKLGTHTFIRIGNSGAVAPKVELGDYCITTGSIRDEGTSRSYVRTDYPAVADYRVTAALVAAAESSGHRYHTGVTWSIDAFYSRNKVLMGDALGSMSVNQYEQSGQNELVLDAQKAGVLNVEMESSTILTLASLFGLRAGCICTVSDRTPWPGPGQDMMSLDTNIRGAIDIAIQAALALAKAEA